MQQSKFHQWRSLPCRVDETTHSHRPKLASDYRKLCLCSPTKKEVIAAESYLVLWATTWMSLWTTLVETFRNLQANLAVDENRTRPQTDYSFRCDSCSIAGNKAKVIPETEVDQSVPPQRFWVVKLFWSETILDLHPDRWRCFSAVKSGNPHLQ